MLRLAVRGTDSRGGTEVTADFSLSVQRKSGGIGSQMKNWTKETEQGVGN